MSTWDRLTGGPARRRRRMTRALRELDRLDAGHRPRRRRRRSAPARPVRASRPARRRLHNMLVTVTTLVVMAGLVLVLTPDLVPASLYRAIGWAPPGAGVAPTGPGSYRFSATQPGRSGVPVTYDRCRTLHVVYNPSGAPRIGEELTRTAIRTVARDTGLRIVYDGTTDRRPSTTSRQVLRAGRTPPALVSFATASQVPALAGRVAGIGGSVRVTDARGSRYVTGQVTLDSEAFEEVLGRSSGKEQAQAIVLHEFGHLVGLDHVDDPGELMDAENTGRLEFGPGDLTGLKALGQGPCA